MYDYEIETKRNIGEEVDITITFKKYKDTEEFPPYQITVEMDYFGRNMFAVVSYHDESDIKGSISYGPTMEFDDMIAAQLFSSILVEVVEVEIERIENDITTLSQFLTRVQDYINDREKITGGFNDLSEHTEEMLALFAGERISDGKGADINIVNEDKELTVAVAVSADRIKIFNSLYPITNDSFNQMLYNVVSYI